jgi:hypothetical protein
MKPITSLENQLLNLILKNTKANNTLIKGILLSLLKHGNGVIPFSLVEVINFSLMRQYAAHYW